MGWSFMTRVISLSSNIAALDPGIRNTANCVSSFMVNPLSKVSKRENFDSNDLGLPTKQLCSRDVILMHRHAISLHAALGAPDQPGVYAGYMAVAGLIKRFVSQAHGVGKHFLVVHFSFLAFRRFYFCRFLPLNTTQHA